MNDAAATARLTDFFAEIKDLAQFMDCDEVGVHTRGFQGETPLKIAVVRQNLRLVKDLLAAGANPSLPGEDDYTPLHHAAGGEDPDIVNLLLHYGASPSLLDMYGHTPVDYANDITRPLLTKNA